MQRVRRKKKTLAEQTAERLTEMIVAGLFEKGAQLPNEFQLAEQLDVGRGTIREAIKILASRQIVEIRRGFGTYILEKPGQVEDPLGLTFIDNKKKLAADLFELRMLIEPPIAALAAQRITAAGLHELEQACSAVETQINAGKPYSEYDFAFHELIARAADNQVVATIIPIIHSAVEVFVELRDEVLTRTTFESHRAIVAAIAAHDSEKAETAMQAHLQRNKEYIERFIAEN